MTPFTIGDVARSAGVGIETIRYYEREGASESRPGAGPAIHPAAPGIGDPGFDADLIVIGGGSAGFAAAITAHEAGARVFMINDGLIGGTCVNVGCVPSKTLIRAAEAHHRARESRFEGVESSSRVVDFLAMREQKDELVSSLRRTKYRDVLEAYERIELIEGRARFVSADAVEVAGRRYRGARFVIATGSRPWVPPIPGLREANPLSSTTAFELDHLPESMIVLGGRYIALEVAQLFARLGVRVTMLQRSAQLLPPEDEDVVASLTGYLRDRPSSDYRWTQSRGGGSRGECRRFDQGRRSPEDHDRLDLRGRRRRRRTRVRLHRSVRGPARG